MSQWVNICKIDDILPATGVCALLGQQQVALFRPYHDDRVYAISNIDPFFNASVLSRGLLGTLGDRVVVASPLYKNHFDLHTGECIEVPEQSVRAHGVRVDGGRISVSVA